MPGGTYFQPNYQEVVRLDYFWASAHTYFLTIDAVELRYRAEEKLDKNRNRAEIAAMLDADTQRLLHELEVHQIELEMQNEQIVQQQKEMEATLSLYTDLFAFAPMG